MTKDRQTYWYERTVLHIDMTHTATYTYSCMVGFHHVGATRMLEGGCWTNKASRTATTAGRSWLWFRHVALHTTTTTTG